MTAITPAAGGPVAPWCQVSSVANDNRLKDVQLPDGVTVEKCVLAASGELYRATANRWSGLRLDVLRPHRINAACRCDLGGYGWDADASGWWNRSFPESGCGCWTSNELVLPSPVTAVEITVDGEVWDSTQDLAKFTVVDNRILVRRADPDTGALVGWPCCQQIAVPATEPGTWSVAVTHGQAPPPAGELAAREWSIQKALFVATNKEKLPQRSTRVSRQGVDITIESGDLLREGKTGIPLVDSFITFYNPSKTKRRARSYSVDEPVSTVIESATPST